MKASELRPGQFFEYMNRRCLWAGVEPYPGGKFYNYVCFDDDNCMLLEYESRDFDVTPLAVTGWDESQSASDKDDWVAGDGGYSDKLQLREGAGRNEYSKDCQKEDEIREKFGEFAAAYKYDVTTDEDGEYVKSTTKRAYVAWRDGWLACWDFSSDLIAEVPPPVEPIEYDRIGTTLEPELALSAEPQLGWVEVVTR